MLQFSEDKAKDNNINISLWTVIAYVTISLIGTSNGIRVWSATKYDSSFNVLDYGAVGDGKHDDSEAFSKAWGDVCGGSGENQTLLVPGDKTFLLTPITFKGPCKSPSLHFQIDGKVVAPDSVSGWGERSCNSSSLDAWLSFRNVHNLLLDGQGQLDAMGSPWWGNISTTHNGNGCGRPVGLWIHECNGLQLRGLTHKDSPKAHIRLTSCNNSIISNLHITAPQDSPNTDGIDVSSTTQLQILDSLIQTGDDCIAIVSPSSWVNISGITCGPGHGISIGSLGHDGANAEVEEIQVRNCTFNKSKNGARIKTWQGGSGYARKITFEDIPLIEVENPLIIDQFYCIDEFGNNKDCKTQPMAVSVSDVRFSGFRGTSGSVAAITLNCSQANPCTNIALDNIEITSSIPGKQPLSRCQNVQGSQNLVAPPVPCLQ